MGPPAIQSEEQRPVNNRSRQTKMSEFWAPWKVLADSYGNEQVQPSLTENPEQIQPLLAGIIREAEEKYLTEQNHEKSSLRYKHQNLPKSPESPHNIPKIPPPTQQVSIIDVLFDKELPFLKANKVFLIQRSKLLLCLCGKDFSRITPIKHPGPAEFPRGYKSYTEYTPVQPTN